MDLKKFFPGYIVLLLLFLLVPNKFSLPSWSRMAFYFHFRSWHMSRTSMNTGFLTGKIAHCSGNPESIKHSIFFKNMNQSFNGLGWVVLPFFVIALYVKLGKSVCSQYPNTGNMNVTNNHSLWKPEKPGGDPKWRSYTFPVPVDGRSSASVAHISRWEDLWGVWESVDLSQVWNNSVPGWEMPVPWQVTQGLEAWLHVFPLVPRRKSQNVTPHFCESLGLFCLNKVKVLRAKSLSPLPWMI